MDNNKYPYAEKGEILKKLRGDLSKTIFAKNLEVDYQTYLRYEKGEREAPDYLMKLVQLIYGPPDASVINEKPTEYQTSRQSKYIQKVAVMMADMDEELQKDICLSVEKEKLLRELLRQRDSDKKTG